MPEHKKGESRKKWMKKCVPHVIKKEGLSLKQARGKCNGMYTNWKKKGNNAMVEEMEYEEGKKYSSVQFKFSATGRFIEAADGGHNMVIAVGNSFMKGIYLSAKELKKACKAFNNTPHDLNHMGTGYRITMFSVVPSDVSYVVGYQDNAHFDDATGEARATIHINEQSMRYNEWKSYVDTCAQMERTPNVSMFVLGNLEWIEARKLPKNSHYGKNGYKADELVPCMTELRPVAVSTVFKGACNDKDGCGIRNNCESGNCNVNKKENKNELSPEIAKRKAYLEKRLKEFKGEK